MDEWGEVGGDVVLKGVGGIGVVYRHWGVAEGWWWGCCVVFYCPKVGFGGRSVGLK